MILTLKQIQKGLQQVSKSNPFIKSFGIGQTDKINADGDTAYPLIYCTIQPASISNDVFMNISYKIHCMDQITPEETNESDVESDTLQILADYLNKIIDHYYSYPISIKYNTTLEPFEDRFTDKVSGWFTTITFTIPMNSSDCLHSY